MPAQRFQDPRFPARRIDVGQRLAFRQNYPVPAQPRAAGIREGDIILGVEDRALAMDVGEFNRYVSRHYLVGDQVVVNVLPALTNEAASLVKASSLVSVLALIERLPLDLGE